MENQDEDGDLIISDDAAETLNNLIALGGAASRVSLSYCDTLEIWKKTRLDLESLHEMK